MGAQNTSQPSSESPSEVMLGIISGFLISRALYALVKLGIPDLLQDQVKGAAELAEATHMHAPSLYRVLCVMVGIGVLAKDDNDRFGLTPLGTTMRKDAPGSLRA